jgi:hypothetical protein
LFPLNFRHLADRMLFARCGKQDNRERNSEDALPNETSHNALAQLSVYRGARKDESAAVGPRREPARRGEGALNRSSNRTSTSKSTSEPQATASSKD